MYEVVQRNKGIFPKALALCLVCLLVFIASCSAGGRPTAKDAPSTGYQSEIASLPAPAGVDPAVWKALKDALGSELEALGGPGGKLRSTSGVPAGNSGRVTNLTYDPGTNKLTWNYHNLGDYDVNGEVGVSDITPIALHYQHANVLDWNDSADPFIDGDGSNEIGVGDITPIALNFLNNITGYNILTCDTVDGSYSVLGHIDVPPGSLTYPPAIETDLPAGSLAYIRVQPTDQLSAAGLPSNATSLSGNSPPIASLTADPTGGDAPLTVNFNASGSVDPDGTISGYEFDWEGDGIYDLTTGDPIQSHDYLFSSAFHATVRVTDSANATDTESVTITVTGIGNAAPTASFFAYYYTWPVGADDNFDASASFDTDGTIVKYEWDWESDGTYDQDTGSVAFAMHAFSAQGTIAVTLRVTDNGGATATVSALIKIDQLPVVSLTAGQGGPTSADFNASASYDPDGTIVLYEWDWNSDGNFDEDSGSNPVTLHDYGVTGTFTATVGVFDNDGFGATAQATAVLTEPHTWTTVLPAGLGDNREPSLAIIGGKPAIAYRNYVTFEISYVAATDYDGTAWGMAYATGAGNGIGISLEELQSMPAISFDSVDWHTYFQRANSSDGSAWYSPVLADPSDGNSWYTSIGFTRNPDNYYFPAVAIYNQNDPGLRFVTSMDIFGFVWEPYVLVDVGSNAGWGLSMTLVSHDLVPGSLFPAIAYYDLSNSDLKYVHAYATDGSVWGAPTILDTQNNDGRSPSLVVYNGKPVVVYSDQTQQAIKVIAAADSQGDTWSQPFVIEGPGTGLGNCSFAVINGVPSVAYTGLDDQGNPALCYKHAFGGDITKWGAREIVDTGSFDYVTLIDTSGFPGIAYTENTGGPITLKYSYRTAG